MDEAHNDMPTRATQGMAILLYITILYIYIYVYYIVYI